MFSFFRKNKPSKESSNEKSNDVKGKSVKATIRYTYEYLDEVPTEERTPCNQFCSVLEEMSKTKTWSRSDIESISERVGYSVWERRGAWIDKGDKDENGEPIEHKYEINGVEQIHCKHQWKSGLYTEK